MRTASASLILGPLGISVHDRQAHATKAQNRSVPIQLAEFAKIAWEWIGGIHSRTKAGGGSRCAHGWLRPTRLWSGPDHSYCVKPRRPWPPRPCPSQKPRFQYVDPGTMAPDMRNMWFIVSKACVPPPRLTATHGGPDFSAEQSAVGQRHQPGAVQQRLHLGAHVGEIRR